MKKQQYINECHLKVIPTTVLVPAGIVRTRFEGGRPPDQLMETFRTYS